MKRNCRQIRFLLGTGNYETNGASVGQFQINYSDGESAEVPIIYGEDVRRFYYCDQCVALNHVPPAASWTGMVPAKKNESLFGARL